MNYKKLIQDALNKKANLNEMKYPQGMKERMHPQLEEELMNQTTSLGKHPIFPASDEYTFEQKIMSNRFKEVVDRYKRAHDVTDIDNKQLLLDMMPMVQSTMELEKDHKKELEELAVKMIREEYNMGEDVVEIIAELTDTIDMSGTKKNPTPKETEEEMEFESHEQIQNQSDEVYKRRFLNAMIQGAAKKVNHMFHMVDDELSKMNPLLPTKYGKMMSAADYMYYIIPTIDDGGVSGGSVRVQFPTEENPKAVIYAQAMVFPVLIHELVKGVMELLSAHGLPEDETLAEHVINKADYTLAEKWDLMLGPALYERFTSLIPAEDFNLKHHLYSELAAMPVKDFNENMKEVMAHTNKGKQLILGMLKDIKEDLGKDDYRMKMNEIEKEAYFQDPNDLDNIDLNGLF
jgi:hypothetical protein